MGRKYMIFRAEWTEEEGADNRLLAHTGAYTDILAEYFDSSNAPIPAPGYRLLEFHSADGSGSSTHYRTGDWEVVRVEEYPTAIPNNEFEAIVVKYCKYLPVESPLIPCQNLRFRSTLLEMNRLIKNSFRASPLKITH